jgi:hypothetical protein
MERAAGIEPATDGLEDRGSASELYPHELAESASGFIAPGELREASEKVSNSAEKPKL